jgi:hypothetical protein
MFGPKRDEVKGEWRRLHKKKLYDLYYFSNTLRVIKSSRMRKVGHVALMGDNGGVYRILVWKPEGKRPLGRLRHRREDNINWIFNKWDGEAWIGLIWLRTETSGESL